VTLHTLHGKVDMPCPPLLPLKDGDILKVRDDPTYALDNEVEMTSNNRAICDIGPVGAGQHGV
jgi:hypothetical protein